MTAESSIPVHTIEAMIRDLLLDALTTPDPPRGRGRPPLLTTGLIWAGMVVSLLRGDTAQRGIWHMLNEHDVWGLGRLSISDDCIYRRLERHGAEDMATLFTLLTEALPPVQPSLAVVPAMTDIVALDCSTMESPQYDEGGPAGKIAALFDLHHQRFRTVLLREDAQENEKVSAPTLIHALPPGALVIMDRGYLSYPLFDQISAEGKYWLTRESQHMSYDQVQVRWHDGRGNEDAIAFLGIYRADRAATPVRRITVMHGKTAHVFVTNVLDEQVLAFADVPLLYARRWDVEMAFKLLKRELGLKITWSANWAVVQAQVWAALAIAQVVLWFRAWLAEQRQESIFDCSLELLLKYLPRYLEFGQNPLEVLLEPGPHGGIFRPSRRKPYPAPHAGAYLALDPRFLTPRQPRYGHAH